MGEICNTKLSGEETACLWQNEKLHFSFIKPLFLPYQFSPLTTILPSVHPPSISYTMENFVKIVFLEKVIPLCVPWPTAKEVYPTPCGFSLLLDNLDIDLPFIP